MTQEGDAQAELRHWLVDYLVTNLACSPEEIDLDAPFNELGVGSRDAVVLSGELSEYLGQPVSPVDFWQNPTINALATALLTGDAEMTGAVAGAGHLGVHEDIRRGIRLFSGAAQEQSR